MDKKERDEVYGMTEGEREWHRESIRNWRMWGSWFSWGSPVGLGLFLIAIGIFIVLLRLHF
ncbi:MAG: hypothetical protein JWL92_366 [Candidatus Nomurabacteria bacterium]|nr:hypothetical protein [Candidatus Nomurabacteria bacterium]